MGDSVRRPLKIPPWQIPYLEKHRIFELFHELARELVINQPSDHVAFIREILYQAMRNRDTARVILLAPAKINCLEIANSISMITKQNVITGTMVLECFHNCCPNKVMEPELKAKCIAHCVRQNNSYEMGWILVDCIADEKEARALLKLGILPTHVIQFIPPFHPNFDEILYCKVPSDWPDYRRRIIGIRSVFKHILKEVFLINCTLEEVVVECVDLLKIKPLKFVIKPRILLIGPRGSGRKTQARLLVENLNLIHIDFERLICEAWMEESELGEKIRACKNQVCFHSELLSEVVHKRVLQKDCLDSGWVLTGFPYNRKDLEFFDCIHTPPNRIIILECDIAICKERLLHRRVNVHTGSTTNIRDHPETLKTKELQLHPKDNPAVIDAELTYYCEQYGDIRRYCGGTAHCINGDQAERWVYESILAVINRAPPAVPCRQPLNDELSSSSNSCDTNCPCTPIPSQFLHYKHGYTSCPHKD